MSEPETKAAEAKSRVGSWEMFECVCVGFTLVWCAAVTFGGGQTLHARLVAAYAIILTIVSELVLWRMKQMADPAAIGRAAEKLLNDGLVQVKDLRPDAVAAVPRAALFEHGDALYVDGVTYAAVALDGIDLGDPDTYVIVGNGRGQVALTSNCGISADLPQREPREGDRRVYDTCVRPAEAPANK